MVKDSSQRLGKHNVFSLNVLMNIPGQDENWPPREQHFSLSLQVDNIKFQVGHRHVYGA